jgi:hypothetical protein
MTTKSVIFLSILLLKYNSIYLFVVKVSWYNYYYVLVVDFICLSVVVVVFVEKDKSSVSDYLLLFLEF